MWQLSYPVAPGIDLIHWITLIWLWLSGFLRTRNSDIKIISNSIFDSSSPKLQVIIIITWIFLKKFNGLRKVVRRTMLSHRNLSELYRELSRTFCLNDSERLLISCEFINGRGGNIRDTLLLAVHIITLEQKNNYSSPKTEMANVTWSSMDTINTLKDNNIASILVQLAIEFNQLLVILCRSSTCLVVIMSFISYQWMNTGLKKETSTLNTRVTTWRRSIKPGFH